MDFGRVQPQLVEVELDVVRDGDEIFSKEISGVAQHGDIVGLLSERGLHLLHPIGLFGYLVDGGNRRHGGLRGEPKSEVLRVAPFDFAHCLCGIQLQGTRGSTTPKLSYQPLATNDWMVALTSRMPDGSEVRCGPKTMMRARESDLVAAPSVTKETSSRSG